MCLKEEDLDVLLEERPHAEPPPLAVRQYFAYGNCNNMAGNMTDVVATAAASRGNVVAFTAAAAAPVQGSNTAAFPTVGAPPSSSHHHDRPEKFMGSEFKRWQQKMLFY
ncbi:hypothetical protein K7X08_005468 [Anisodus acutangulus]|uniref:Uncharacterized protein n=1 Tax=Anisodus acutangulus TaxID=402998 RepID=A0A9Q1R877_9SOLA|nr:hypothetical protein K7X08_005468 [Anisodus acutangulus]